MQDWSHPGPGRAAGSEAEEREQADAGPDRPEPVPPADEPADWDELTPAGTARLTPPADVLVAGAPLAEPGRPAGATPAGAQPGGAQPSGAQPSGAQPSGGSPAPAQAGAAAQSSGSQLSGSHLSGSQAGAARPTQLTDRPGPDAGGLAETTRRGGAAILDSGAADGFQARWRDVQYGFVDDPRGAVRQADDLADEVLSAFTDALTAHKRALEERWRTQQATQQDTERLRLLIRAYREFVDRLLTT
ncbi:MAG TPA: hypothetical protein VF069_25035 [Streptosporangiaceae bacterium]